MQKNRRNYKLLARRMTTGILAATLTLTLSACGGGSGGSGSDENSSASGGAEETVFRLAGTGVNASGVDPITIGVEKGFFAEENIKIEDVGDMDVLQFVAMLENGSIDAAMIMESDGIAAIDQGADIIEVAVSMTTTKEYPHMVFLVADDSPINTVEDFVGKRYGAFGINGCMTGFPYEYLSKAGIENPHDAIEVITSPENTLIDSLLKDDLDVVGIHGPVSKAVVERNYPDTRIFFSDYDIFGENGGDIGWYVSRKLAEEKPELVRAFVSGIAKSNNFVNENPDEAADIYKPLARNGINEDIFEIKSLAVDGLIKRDHVETWLNVFSEGKSFQTLQNEWTFDQVATNEFNPNA
jgi:NitT/TauT family transport system substrate-binding protein